MRRGRHRTHTVWQSRSTPQGISLAAMRLLWKGGRSLAIRCRGSRWFVGALLACLLPVLCGGCDGNGSGRSTLANLAVRQTNLLSDGAVPAAVIDPNLVNAWGLV